MKLKKDKDHLYQTRTTTRGNKVGELNWTKKKAIPKKSTGEEKKFYSTYSWQQTRERKVKNTPLCELCKARGILSPVRMVHHITPLDEMGEQLDQENLMSICKESEHRVLHKMIEDDKKKRVIKWDRDTVIEQYIEYINGAYPMPST